MAAAAKKWEKDLIRNKGVTIFKYTAGYSKAVEEGRIQVNKNQMCYLIDDEKSNSTFD
ncbi:serine dehydratase [Bacillus cereus]|uniref:serine dehydratase n=1 Tax=Bacillus cereus TaxID=1396 RepID=UPI000BEB5E46|nr:serine dehydratase [Bacillus cereus]PED88793.1 serine dehydratase [Bacillus cereus]PER62492.1 serine dehydratase [Bacillus cereus]PEW64559.1 serine dehydratase [Bacillus cereus]PFD13406.1 serine dehydratase [Bacillus cereus]PFM03755.1 serine dehydratase [Bacillus cereus]